MNGKERMYALLKGETPDSIPVFPKISYACTIAADPPIAIGRYMEDPACMAAAIVASYRRFGYDAVGVTTDISVNAMALGSAFQWHENAPYSLDKPLMANLEQLERIVIPADPWAAKGQGVVLRAVQIIKREIGDEAFIQAWTNGPLNIASQLLPYDELLMALYDDPESVHALLDICTVSSANYARALAEAGADAIAFGHASASSNVLSREHYLEYALFYEQKLVEAIHAAGVPAITHICGKIEPIIRDIAQNGSEMIDFDADNDIEVLLRETEGNVFRGNIATNLMSRETAEEVYDSCAKLIDRAKGSKRFILGVGCEVQADTPPENLEAFVRAGRDFGKY